MVGGLLGSNESGKVLGSHAASKVRGNTAAGGLVGRNSSGGIVQSSHAVGEVEGNTNVGGLAGENLETVENSYATGNVRAITGEHDDGDNVGGLVGRNFYGSTVRNSYATGNVEGASAVGGLVGWNDYDSLFGSGLVQSCVALNSSVVSSDSNVGRVVGNNEGTLSNNHAHAGMVLSPHRALIDNGNDSASVDGKSVLAGSGAEQFGHFSFWGTAPLSWDFSSIWQWGPHNLPILQNVGGAQDHTAP
jgi:hypothetical protein